MTHKNSHGTSTLIGVAVAVGWVSACTVYHDPRPPVYAPPPPPPPAYQTYEEAPPPPPPPASAPMGDSSYQAPVPPAGGPAVDTLTFTFTPQRARRGDDVKIYMNNPESVTIYLNGRPLPKQQVTENGRMVTVTIPGNATTGHFEIEYRGRRVRSPVPITIE